MKYYENPDLAKEKTQRLLDIIDGKIAMPAVQFQTPEERLSGFHRSEFDLCQLPSYYSRIIPREKWPMMPVKARLHFSKGRMIERMIAQEEAEPVQKDNIWMTIDELSQGEMESLLEVNEIKSTSTSYEKFKPHEVFPHWIERTSDYAYTYCQNHFNLIVYFIVGNLMSFAVWAIGRDKPKSYEGSPCIKAWTYEFDNGEMDANWQTTLKKKAVLERCLKNGHPPQDSYVVKHLPYREKKGGKKVFWQCRDCKWKPVCEYYEENILKEE